LESQGIFQQDNARPHTTQKIRDWFTEKKINCLEWPPQSPDLSPIENIWSFIKDFLNDHKKELTNNEAIWNLTQQCWFSNDLSNLIKKCYESLPNRIKEVIQNNGGPTCY
jgi:transposase